MQVFGAEEEGADSIPRACRDRHEIRWKNYGAGGSFGFKASKRDVVIGHYQGASDQLHTIALHITARVIDVYTPTVREIKATRCQ